MFCVSVLWLIRRGAPGDEIYTPSIGVQRDCGLTG